MVRFIRKIGAINVQRRYQGVTCEQSGHVASRTSAISINTDCWLLWKIIHTSAGNNNNLDG